MAAYYNEFDPHAAAWLRELIARRLIADGEVDERSIEDVRPDELAGFTQCHFFAGIGVWSHALRRAGWSDDRPVWTGSCPCQPFSAAGKGEGFADERHLWPAFFHLIEQCEPAIVLGEQVAGGGVGPWFDLIQADLEAMGYAFGLVPLPAAGFGAAHIRDRAFWVAYTASGGWQQEYSDVRRRAAGNAPRQAIGCSWGGDAVGLADADGLRRERVRRRGQEGATERRAEGGADAPMLGRNPADWLFCRDGKWRPVEPGAFPLAHDAPARMGRLRGYGNAIDAETATAFIEVVNAFTNLGASHLSTRAKLAGEENSHVLPSQTIAALGAQARDDLSNQNSNRNSFVHEGMNR